MSHFTKENTKEMQARALAVRLANKAKRDSQPETPPFCSDPAQAHLVRLWGILAALDKKLAAELARGHPDGALVRDLSTARRTLLADGAKPSKAADVEPSAPALADPEPAQE